MVYYDSNMSRLNELLITLLQLSNIFVVLCVLLKLLTSTIFKYSDAQSESNHAKKLLWKVSCEEAYNVIRTPRRFSKKNAIELPSKPLLWSWEYKHTPCNMQISNKTGHVLLEAQYSDSQPHLSGGPLDSEYQLQHIVFKLRTRKAKTDIKRFILELQAVHFKTEFVTGAKDIENITLNNTGKSLALIINYIYKISEEENFAMQQMISRFSMIEEHDSSCYVNPFPLSWILPIFTEYYYIQQKSQPCLPFAQGVQWILSPVEQTMSKQQMDTFIKILNPNYTMELNKNKHFNKKEIFFCSEIEEEP